MALSREEGFSPGVSIHMYNGRGSAMNRFIVLVLSFVLGCTYSTENHYYLPPSEAPAKESPMDDLDLLGIPTSNVKDRDRYLVAGTSREGTLICGNTLKEVTMQVDFDEAGPHTVQFDLTPPTRDILIGGVFIVEAIVDWKVGGNTISRRITPMDGMCITGNAEGVRVRVYDRTTDVVLAGSNEPYQVGMTVTKGARATSSMPPVWIPNPAVTLVAGSTDVTVPDDIGANSVMVMSSAPPAPDVNAAIAQQRCSNALPGLLAQWDPYGARFVPLDSNAAVIRMTAVAAYMKVIFGIDG